MRPPPRFVEREFRRFLRCGIFAHGFLRVHCDACGCDRLVPFSCKGRGFCSSCGGRRMADTAAHLGLLPASRGPRCANIGGVSLHANVAVPARDRLRLERLCRYATRPPLATERLSRLSDGRLLYKLKHRWRDGTTHIGFEPLELLEKLAALVPPPRVNFVRYHGVLAPAARHRARVVPPDPTRLGTHRMQGQVPARQALRARRTTSRPETSQLLLGRVIEKGALSLLPSPLRS